MTADTTGQYDEHVDKPWVFAGALVLEVVVVFALWAFSRIFGA
jgi:hypothetical protein